MLDFDGTLSLLRAGWQQVMTDQFVDALARHTATSESTVQLEAICRDFITRLTGRQTVYQTLQLEEEISKRGGEPLPALEYKKRYLDLLSDHIHYRIDAVRSDRRPTEDYLLRGSVELLRGLTAGGVTCFLASGTDLNFVLEEAELLGLTRFFRTAGEELRIYGALEEYRKFSKKMVIERILAEHGVEGSALAVFGDGYVEIGGLWYVYR